MLRHRSCSHCHDPSLSRPAGLTVATDDQLQALLAEIDAWKARLPEDLSFHGPDTPRNAGKQHRVLVLGCHHDKDATLLSGLLFMFYVCVNILFWRVFMRISYACPAHLKFALSVEKWTELVQLSRQVIDWLDAHERLYDVWLLVAYCATSCALVQVCYTFLTNVAPAYRVISGSIIHGRGDVTPRRR